ncbi:MAG: LysR family transcriptional regulator [Hyphomicrobiales bacterium]|nr:LysR family transcriptional regulator [Hyphomicrobiales bacterium]
MVALRLQIRVSADVRIGHGKIQLLEGVDRYGSISAAARALGMSYRRGWELIDHMNTAFGRPVAVGTTGSTGGAELTDLGRDIVARWRLLEQKVSQIATDDVAYFDELLQDPSEQSS